MDDKLQGEHGLGVPSGDFLACSLLSGGFLTPDWIDDELQGEHGLGVPSGDFLACKCTKWWLPYT